MFSVCFEFPVLSTNDNVSDHVILKTVSEFKPLIGFGDGLTCYIQEHFSDLLTMSYITISETPGCH